MTAFQGGGNAGVTPSQGGSAAADRALSAFAALRRALPVLRQNAEAFLECVAVGRDPLSITPMEWAEVAPDLDAILAAQACVGRQPDFDGVDTAFLDLCLRHHRDGGSGS